MGLVATPSPGSVFALLAMTPKGNFVGVIAGVAIATIVSFVICSIFVKLSKADSALLEQAKQQKDVMKNQSKGMIDRILPAEGEAEQTTRGSIQKIVVACDAGMGSSAMAASVLQKKVKAAGLNITVVHAPIQRIPADADLIITHAALTASAVKARPDVEHRSISSYLNAPEYDALIEELKKEQ